ncbi:MAG: hypothetical protein KME49_00435 [Brasilonema octagenarum HA4186-MV1]|jgi:hypothetical protein|nr:hypothetical protein [Brasilonema octagenarum HA4186-MV1]
MTDLKASNAALQVTQQAVWVLAQIAGVQLLSECEYRKTRRSRGFGSSQGS